MNFAKIAKSLREETGLSQQKLADNLGISSSGIAHLELSESEPKSATLIAYSKFFDVSTDYLLGLEDDFGTRTSAPMKIASLSSSNYSDEERRIIEEYRKLPESSKQLFRRMAGITDKVIKN